MEEVKNLIIMVQFTIQNIKMTKNMVFKNFWIIQIKLQKNVFIEMERNLVI